VRFADSTHSYTEIQVYIIQLEKGKGGLQSGVSFQYTPKIKELQFNQFAMHFEYHSSVEAALCMLPDVI